MHKPMSTNAYMRRRIVTAYLGVNLTEAVREAAARKGVTISEWFRQTVTAALAEGSGNSAGSVDEGTVQEVLDDKNRFLDFLYNEYSEGTPFEDIEPMISNSPYLKYLGQAMETTTLDEYTGFRKHNERPKRTY